MYLVLHFKTYAGFKQTGVLQGTGGWGLSRKHPESGVSLGEVCTLCNFRPRGRNSGGLSRLKILLSRLASQALAGLFCGDHPTLIP